jgi:hypothetical protein
LIYLNQSNYSIICSIQTRFAIYSLNKSLTCTEQIYLHPRFNLQIKGQVFISDCRAFQFEQNIYQKSVQFHRTNFLPDNQLTIMKSSETTCEYILENTNYLNNISFIQTKELSTTITIVPLFNPWKKDIQILGPCRTKLIPYREMFFTEDIGNIRNIHIEQGQTIQIKCKVRFK